MLFPGAVGVDVVGVGVAAVDVAMLMGTGCGLCIFIGVVVVDSFY